MTLDDLKAFRSAAIGNEPIPLSERITKGHCAQCAKMTAKLRDGVCRKCTSKVFLKQITELSRDLEWAISVLKWAKEHQEESSPEQIETYQFRQVQVHMQLEVIRNELHDLTENW